MIGSTPRFLTYQAGRSVLHRLDPRTKLFCVAAIVAGALLASVPWGMAAVYLLAAVAGVLTRNYLSSLWRVLRPLLVLIALFGVIVAVVTPGKAFLHVWLLAPSYDGVALAVRLGLQALVIIFTTSLMSLTTPPLDVAESLQWTFGWLERFRLPVRDIIAMVAIGLTFVPLLIEETQKVIAAQRARGADLGINALLEEQAMGALLIPLLLANLRRGEELAESMEARLYATGPRTSLRRRRFGRADVTISVSAILGTAVVVVLTFVWPR